MTKKDNLAKPLSRRTISRALKARAALRDNLSQVTTSFFVAGAEDPTKVDTKVIPVERAVNGQKSLHYKVRDDVNGVRLGERVSPPGLRAEAVNVSIAQEQLRECDDLLTALVSESILAQRPFLVIGPRMLIGRRTSWQQPTRGFFRLSAGSSNARPRTQPPV